MKKLKIIGILIGLSLTFYLGTKFSGDSATPLNTEQTQETKAKEEVVWTCSMHPQIKLQEPGLCPICGMTLIPLETGGATGNDAQLIMNEWDKKLAQIVTAPVQRKFVEVPVRMVGKLEYDETKVKTISSWVAGRVERLFVDYTGIPVTKGDHWDRPLLSPDWLTSDRHVCEY